MLKDNIQNLHNYTHLHPNFRSLFNILQSLNLDALQDGHIELDGEYLFININTITGRTKDQSPLEAHKRYIDIQIPLSGPETFGFKPTADCTNIQQEFNQDMDVTFYGDTPTQYIDVNPQEFIIFFPEDAHAPCITTSTEHQKMVVKISVQPNTEVPKL